MIGCKWDVDAWVTYGRQRMRVTMTVAIALLIAVLCWPDAAYSDFEAFARCQGDCWHNVFNPCMRACDGRQGCGHCRAAAQACEEGCKPVLGDQRMFEGNPNPGGASMSGGTSNDDGHYRAPPEGVVHGVE